eukprot:SAG11_NODE_3525_length_2394_cov_1.450545_3_plen_113_part_00
MLRALMTMQCMASAGHAFAACVEERCGTAIAEARIFASLTLDAAHGVDARAWTLQQRVTTLNDLLSTIRRKQAEAEEACLPLAATSGLAALACSRCKALGAVSGSQYSRGDE